MNNNKSATAKDWILKLANGINPLDGSAIKEDDIVNNVHISRCLFYVADLIEITTQKNSKKSKEDKLEFSISVDALSKIYVSERSAISNFVREINKVIPDNMKGISNNKILNWLIDNGYLRIVVTDSGTKIKRPTEAGQSIGISTEQMEGPNGSYVAVLYNANAQRFILNNIYAIIES